jgi:hypothetical protein
MGLFGDSVPQKESLHQTDWRSGNAGVCKTSMQGSDSLMSLNDPITTELLVQSQTREQDQ